MRSCKRVCYANAPAASSPIGLIFKATSMCGIFGGSPEPTSAQAADLLRHRGPDQQGQVLIETASGRPLVIGQTRLSVVYKEDVPTPMQKLGAVIAFNGEVYNWLELRGELEGRATVSRRRLTRRSCSPPTSSGVPIACIV